MMIEKFDIIDHKILGNLSLNFVNPQTGKPYSIIAFVGENSCGKTTILNEIFNYCENTLINDKQKKNLHAVFVRQNSAFINAMNELTAKISGGEPPFPISTKRNAAEENVCKNSIEEKEKQNVIIEEFNDEKILEIYRSGDIDSILCGGVVGKLIDNNSGSINLSELSSGEQELVLKLKSIRQIMSDTDAVLFDEPETSLHPRWQLKIVQFVREITKNSEGENPQIFIATHSEKVLESIIDKEDTLIVHVHKEDNHVCVDPLYDIPFCLSKPTFAELNYLIFKINSYDYHNLLITELGCLIGKDDKMHAIDKHIKHHTTEMENILRPWIFERKGIEEKFETLPIFIRNNFHHPRKDVVITESDLDYSVLVLRALIKEIIDNKN